MKFVCIKRTNHNSGKTYYFGDVFTTDDPANFSRSRFTEVPDDYQLPDVEKRFLTLHPVTAKPIARPQSEINEILHREAEQEAQRLENQERQKLRNDMNFGKVLIEDYLFDNRKLKLSLQDSIKQKEKFSGVQSLLEVGAIPDAKTLLSNIEIDTIFTQERKNKYTQKISNYLGE